MKTMMKKSILSLAVLATLSACTNERLVVYKDREVKAETTKPAGQPATQVEPVVVDPSQQSADELADAAEQLAGPYTFMLAYKVAGLALEKDPSNIKAQFYRKLLARTEVFRGIMPRVKPILNDASQKEWQNTKEQFPESPLKSFLYETSKQPLKNKVEVQEILAEYTNSLRSFRNLLLELRRSNQEVTLNLNPHLFEEKIRKEMVDSCTVDQENEKFTIKCDRAQVARVKMNVADFIALSQVTAGEIFYFGFLNSYSLNGLDKVMEQAEGKTLTPKDIIPSLLANEGFGKLRKDNTITMIKEIGADLNAAIKYAMEYQSKLCPIENSNDGSVKQRKGFLFDHGFCVSKDAEIDHSMTLFGRALQGAIPMDLYSNKLDEPITVNVDLFAWAQTPIKDLRSVAPTAYTKCGKVAAIKDNTLSGILPDGTFDQFIDANCN